MKKLITLILALATLCSLCAGCGTQQEQQGDVLHIVSGGISGYVIVIPEEASECEKFSAQEMQSFIKSATGAELQIVTDAQLSYSPMSRFISIGGTTLLERSGLQMPEGTRMDAYALTSENYCIYIYGNSDRASLYGAYEFLESFVGVRFLTADNTYVPESADLAVTFPVSILQDPAFDQRQYWTADATSDPLYAARKRVVTYWQWSEARYGYGMYRDFYAAGHNVISLLTLGAAAYGLEQVPESAYATDLEGNKLWADINGSKVYDVDWSDGIAEDGSFITEVPTDENGNAVPTAAQLMLAGLKQYMADNPMATIFCVMQEDTPSVVCDCAECHAGKEKYGAVSANIIRMLNALATELNAYSTGPEGDGRDVRLATLAYSYSQDAPVQLKGGEYSIADETVRPNDKVIVEYCTMDYCNHTLSINDPGQSEAHKDALSKWEWLCSEHSNLAIYTYTSNFNCTSTYIPNFKTIQENIIYNYENLNRDMITLENAVYTGDWQQALRMYVASELMWDPYADTAPLVEEFLTLNYGRSAPVVGAYIERMEALCDYNRAVYGSEFDLWVADHTDYMIHSARYWPIAALETSVNELKAEMAAVESDETLTDEEKLYLTDELGKVLLSPMMQINYHYDTYYGYTDAKEDFQAELAALLARYPAIEAQAKSYGLIA